MLVTKTNFHEVLQRFVGDEVYGLDSETSGLKESDRFFSLILANSTEEYYFNFWPYPDAPEGSVLPRSWLKHLQHPFNNLGATWAMSDAKFDMRMLHYEGLEIHGNVWCIQAQERVLFNDLFPAETEYGLSRMAERRGLAKDDAVEDYITKHKLWDLEVVPGKKTVNKLKKFYEVPLNIIQPYAEMDAKLARTIACDQMGQLSQIQVLPGQPSPYIVSKNEQRLTKTLLRMERHGIKVDKQFTSDAIRAETVEIERATKDFEKATGMEFVDGRSCLVEAFTKLGESYPTTAKGNPSFTEDVLGDMKTPVASMVNRIRKHTKRANTYYSSYLHYQQNGIIHVNYRPAGTETGRMSCGNPNIQNVPKEDEPEDKNTKFPVRGCFVPREGMCFVAIDYSAMEYRLILDYAGETETIALVNSGMDLHQAIADMVGVTRKLAKTLSFAILYGAGIEKLAGMLGVSYSEAANLREKYLAKLPRVKKLISNIVFSGQNRGFIWNHFGRKLNLKSYEFAYALPNHLIQGSGADCVKIAMNVIDDFLLIKKYKTKMLLQIHDEILFEMPKEEFHIIPYLTAIMESVYVPRNGLPLKVDVSHSWKSWSYWDMQKGQPQ